MIMMIRTKKDKKALEEDKDKIIEELWNGELVEKKRFDFNMCIMDTFEDIALIIKNPVLGARIYLEKDEYYNSICMVLIQAIVSAALVMIYLFALNINLDDKNLKFSIFAGFVYTLLLSLVYTILFIILLYGVSYCFKAGISLKKSLEIVSIKSVPIFAVDTLACFLIIFSIKFGIWLFILSSLIGCLYVIFAYSTEVSINMDKRLFIILITMVVIYTVFAIFFKSIITLYLPESMSKQVGDILSVIKNIAN